MSHGSCIVFRREMEQRFNLKTIGVIMIWIGILIGLAYFSPIKKTFFLVKNGENKTANIVNAKLITDEKEYDFGDVSMADGKVRHSYRLKNEGTEALNIEAIWTSCMCTTAEVKTADGRVYGPFGMSGHGGKTEADFEISAGQEFELIAEFNPNAHGPDATGPLQRTMFVKTNASKEPLGLSFLANVTK